MIVEWTGCICLKCCEQYPEAKVERARLRREKPHLKKKEENT